MTYKFFDKCFLVFPDEDCLGKKVFFFDTYKDLIEEVESGDVCRIRTIDGVHKDAVYPFNIDGTNWILAYYDPNYEAKVAYYKDHKQIQFRTLLDKWEDVCKYRVKPDKWFVHSSVDEYGNCIGQPYYKDTDNKKFVAFEGTEEECDKWIEEHTPKTRRFTYRELAKWCADNKGQVESIDNYVTTYWGYDSGDDEYFVPDGTRIREWGSDEWHEPLMEVTE